MTHTNRILSTLLGVFVIAFLASCQQSVNAPNGGSKILAQSILPVPDGNDSHSITDIPTPSFTGNSISAGTNTGHKVCLTWQSNSPDNTTFDYSTGTNPTTPTALNVDASGHDYGWEYWGCTQNAIVTLNNGGQPAYSGHYELTMTSPDNTQTEVDVTGDSYCFDNLADGTYSFTLKAKSNEGSTPNTMTHHSATTSGYSVTVSSCTEVPIANTYSPVTVAGAGGNGTWSGTTWTPNASQVSQNTNIIFDLNEWTNTQNSCTNAITATPVSGGYQGSLYISLNQTTWVGPAQPWSTYGYYQYNGNAGGHGLGKLDPGTYTVYLSTTSSSSGEIGTFTVYIP